MDGTKTWTIGIIVLTVVILGAIIAAAPKQQSTSQPVDNAQTVEILAVQSNDWIRGKSDAPITLVEYSDFQCPACASFESTLQRLLAEYPNDLRLIYRHWPLPQHANAQIMARAAETAGKQNKFWEMHDRIFVDQNNWKDAKNGQEIVLNYAREIGLDTAQFETDLTDPEILTKIQTHTQHTSSLNLSGTPTFFLNGQQIENPRGYEEFKSKIEELK